MESREGECQHPTNFEFTKLKNKYAHLQYVQLRLFVDQGWRRAGPDPVKYDPKARMKRSMQLFVPVPHPSPEMHYLRGPQFDFPLSN